MSILKKIDQIIEDIKKLSTESDYSVDYDQAQQGAIEVMQDYGRLVSKELEDVAMINTLKQDLKTQLEKYSYYSELKPKEIDQITDLVLTGVKELPKEEELLSLVAKSLKAAPVDELVKTVYSEEDIIRIGRITLPNASRALQYEEGMAKLVDSYDNINGIEDLVAQSMKKVRSSKDKLAEYFKLYMGV